MHGDAQALRSAMRNMLDNAVKYGGQRVELGVRATGDGGWHVRVDDDGPGIPPAQRERVFERFQRGEGRDAEGSGLGLAIVQAVASRHGATVELGDSRWGGLSVQLRGPRRR
jgi:signal transduction histidine kinase